MAQAEVRIPYEFFDTKDTPVSSMYPSIRGTLSCPINIANPLDLRWNDVARVSSNQGRLVQQWSRQ